MGRRGGVNAALRDDPPRAAPILQMLSEYVIVAP